MQATAPQVQPPEIGEPFEGGFYAGQFWLNNKIYALIVSPKKEGDIEDTEWNSGLKSINAESYCDGMANTLSMAGAGSVLAQKIRSLNINAFDDWYLPSQDELEILYRAFKPTGDANWRYARSGINVSAVTPTYPYSATSPGKTSVETFKEGKKEAFETMWYWSSTQHAANADFAWCQDFGYGHQTSNRKHHELRARAVRRVAI